MKPFPAREVHAALLRKGFVKRQGDHAYYHFKYRGCDVGVSTKISHGEKEIGPGLSKRIARKCGWRPTPTSAALLICPLTFEEYVALLKRLGIISDD